MKKLGKKWIVAITAAAVLTVSCVAVAAAAYQTGTPPQEVSEQQAKEIAFKHAGVGTGDVSALEIQRELENGHEVYAIEFNANGKEYEYDIRISDGEIVQSSQEVMGQPAAETTQPAATDPVQQPAETSGSGSATPTNTSAVTAEEARAIALKHAGVAETDLIFIQVKEDYEDGVAVYEVEFYAGNQEYDYDIVRATGEILKYDYDVDHFTPDTAAQVDISLADARDLALAKVSGASESNIYLELDWDDGRPVYEGEIIYGGMEYEFEIDASTGTFLEWSMDHKN